MAPVVHGLENKYGGEVLFTYLDIDDGATAEYRQALNYVYQPHIFLLDEGGTVVRQWVGVVSGEDLELAIQDALYP